MGRLAAAVAAILLVACGDGVDAGPTDARTPPTVIGGSNYDDRPDCFGANQIGCDDSEKCGIIAEEWACLLPGDRLENESCSVSASGDDCAAGLHCYQDTCFPLCANSAPCEDDSLCVAIPSEADQLKICLTRCDAIDQDCADTGSMARQGCYLLGEGGVCAPVAQSPPTVPGSACSYLNECAVGSGCVLTDGVAKCRAYCDFLLNANSNDPHCSAEGRCSALQGSSDVGICR